MMNTDTDRAGQGPAPLAGARPVLDAAAQPYHERWRLIETSGQPVPADDPALARVEVTLRFGFMVLRAPGMLRLDVPLEVIEDDPSVFETFSLEGKSIQMVDEGAWAAEWFSQVLGRPVRLMKRCSD